MFIYRVFIGKLCNLPHSGSQKYVNIVFSVCNNILVQLYNSYELFIWFHIAQLSCIVAWILNKSNETPIWCNTVQVLFLQSQSTCFGRKHPSSGVFKTSTAATGTCVIVAGKSSHLLIRASCPNKEMRWLTCNDNTCTSGRCTSFKYPWWWVLAPETCRVTLQK